MGQPLTGHRTIVQSLCFSPDGRLLASGSSDSTIRLWDPQTGEQLAEPLTDSCIGISYVSFSPDGLFIVAFDSVGDCLIWDGLTHQRCHTPPLLPSHIAIGLQNCWLTVSSSRLLWLPADYWDTSKHSMSLHNKALAIAHGKSISIFDLSDLL